MQIKSIAPYTRFVKSAKVFLGMLVLGLMVLMFLYPLIKKSTTVRIAFGNVDKGESAPTQMKNANFHGFDENNQPYNVTATVATQIDQNTIEFDKINGDISLNTGKWINITADKGRLQVNEKLLSLTDNVEMFTDDGYEMRTQAMKIDVGKKLATSEVAVEGYGTLGTLNSLGAVFDGNKHVAVFKKPVHVKIYMPAHETNSLTTTQ